MRQQNYQVEYKYNGVQNIFEFYLFINPLGTLCYQSEQEITKAIDVISTNTDIYILPFHNQDIVNLFMERKGIKRCHLGLRNEFYRKMYHASLAFIAASMQGQKKGRHFLMEMQAQVSGEIDRFDKALVLKIAKQCHLDLETFRQDINSDFVRNLYLKNQNIAKEMLVHRTPTLVIQELQSGDVRTLTDNDIEFNSILDETDDIVAQYFYQVAQGPVQKTKKHTQLRILRKK
ncbi:DsbA family protein [Eremococcus coleocola]|uniref:DsbA family protein n=1 Tax=Eremococcus coleocola TaxID=88132 RepID=UPI000414831E|nr:DsbA family protein [Eremococcus coleocola]